MKTDENQGRSKEKLYFSEMAAAAGLIAVTLIMIGLAIYNAITIG